VAQDHGRDCGEAGDRFVFMATMGYAILLRKRNTKYVSGSTLSEEVKSVR
jgi:hypothetical protein